MSEIKRTQAGENAFLQQMRQIPCLKKTTSQDSVQANTDIQDRIQISKNEDTLSSFLRLLGQLHQKYPSIHIMIEKPTAEDERDILSDVLDEMGDGYALILSKEFMESLHAGKASYDRKAKVLLSCMQKLSGLPGATGVWLEEDKAIFWTNTDESIVRQAQKSEAENSWISKMLPSPSEQKAQKFRLSTTSSYRTATSYARMSQAKNKMAVQTVMQQARRDIASLKLISVFGDDEDRIKAKAAIRSLQKLLLRGNKKIKKFSEEELTRHRLEQAAEKKQHEKEMQAQLELKRQKTSRAIFNGILQKEGQLEELNSIPVYRRNRRIAHMKELILPPPQIPTSGSIETETSAETDVSPAEITVIDIVSF